ncbi:MAG: LLM class flavin-dependent oxidoreductase, partial [Desulfobacterales bacterium]|nr:LLM class flavin-dependent oxidoreductase [Desulfobacterales bacterium]
LPRPLQAELPLWVTTAGNIDSYTRAAEIGANVLTHVLGQTIEEVAEKVKAYRAAWKAAGHPGEGIVTVMLHTFVGPDAGLVEEHVRQPLKDYLKSAMFLVKAAAWQFPTFKKMSEQQGKTLDDFFETISDEDMDGLLEFSFQRYFHTSGLFGTPASAMQMVDKVKEADVNEIACLIDFGIDDDLVLEHLPYLNELREYSQRTLGPEEAVGDDYSLPALFQRHQVTHFQCTPSMATMLAADSQARPGLAELKHMMVGGEAFPPELATELKSLVSGRVSNMYGPTETTIWSSTGDVDGEGASSVSIGRPLVNQQMHILDENQQCMPIGLAGELVIGGDSVVRGYHNRADLTEKAFLTDIYSERDGARLYRTGDLARYLPDGRLECMGRVDHQVKIRGYRVELGEIESLLRQHATVMEAAVILREDTPGDKRLVAYIRCHTIQDLDVPALKSFLMEQLPDFMVPSVFVALHELPLTPNGKIDRKGLPRPQQSSTIAEDSKPPENDAEIMIADIWKRALDIPTVGVRDNFFDIGGHSLLIIQVLKDLNEVVSKPVKMTDLFKYTTIESLAGFLSGESEGSEGVSKGRARAAARKASMGRRRRSRK